jgi:predicted Zn-dependent protease
MHTLMGARSRVLMDSSTDGLRRQRQRLDDALTPGVKPLPFNERLGALYGAALAASLLRDNAAAEAAVNKALQLLRERSSPAAAERVLVQLQAQLWMQRGDAAAALALLDAPLFQPASRSTLLLRAQAAVLQVHAKGEPGEAPACAPAQAPAGCAEPSVARSALRQSTEALQSWVASHPNDALAWGLLGQAEELQGQRLRAVRAQAEARAAVGDIGGAIDRLRAGQALVRSGAANDYIEASVIDARLRQLEAQRRQLMAELRGRPAPLASTGTH